MRSLLAFGLGALLLACGRPASLPPRPTPDPASADSPESPVPPLPAALQPAPVVALTRPLPAQSPQPAHAAAPDAAPDAAPTTYTCPMHPEVRMDHPGTCPTCGMTLVPRTQGNTGGRP